MLSLMPIDELEFPPSLTEPNQSQMENEFSPCVKIPPFLFNFVLGSTHGKSCPICTIFSKPLESVADKIQKNVCWV